MHQTENEKMIQKIYNILVCASLQCIYIKASSSSVVYPLW